MKQTATILIVDDDAMFRDLLTLFLNKQGYQVCPVESGPEALLTFQQNKIDLVLLDADMPEMDGFETCRQLTALPSSPLVPIIIVTGFQDETSVDQAYDSGAIDYVSKPIHWAALRRRLANTLRSFRNKQALEAALVAKKKAEDQLHRAQRMEAIGLMASGVAHDLNNILSGIVTYPELLLLDLPPDSPMRPSLEIIQESGHRATQVVADLLTVARGIASVKEAVDLNEMIHIFFQTPEVKKLIDQQPNIVLNTQLSAPPPHIYCSAVHFNKVLFNLVMNAYDALGEEGNITLSTETCFLDQPLPGYDQIKTGPYVCLTIHDNGPGITPEDMGHIFEPFYSKKVMGRSGTGLGLSVVWNTIHDHKGYIQVCTDHAGTAFKIYCPPTKELISSGRETLSVESLSGHGETILIIDDEAPQRAITQKLLTRLGYNCKTVENGEQAVDYLKTDSADLLILDMLMGVGMNGRETYEKILEFSPQQKAVLASGYAENIEVKAAKQLGAGAFIKKPYSLIEIGRAVKQVLTQ